MRIDLDEHYCIVLNQWGNPVLVKHGKQFELDKHGDPIGKKFFFQTFGQAFRRRIKLAEESRESRVINDIRDEIGKRGITDKGAQIDYLYSIGLGCTRIGKILKLSHNTVADRILKLRKENPSVQGKNSIHYIDALVLMRNGMTGIDDKTFKSYQY